MHTEKEGEMLTVSVCACDKGNRENARSGVALFAHPASEPVSVNLLQDFDHVPNLHIKKRQPSPVSVKEQANQPQQTVQQINRGALTIGSMGDSIEGVG